jgi:hypothetical protein
MKPGVGVGWPMIGVGVGLFDQAADNLGLYEVPDSLIAYACT